MAASPLLPTPNIDPSAIHALIDEVKLLSGQIEQATANRPRSRAMEDLQTSVTATNAVLETLPDRIAKALAGALAKQHQMIMNDVQAALRQFATKFEHHDDPR